MKKKLVVIGMTLVFLTMVFSGCMDTITDTGGQISETINPPDFVITSKEGREGYEGADRVGYVDVTIRNNGGTGKGTVYAKTIQGSNEWTKSKSFTLGHDESTSFNFRFTEIKFWTLDSWSYTVWVE